MTILITGNIATGKSSVIQYLQTKKYPCFKSDDQAKKLLHSTGPCFKKLKNIFKKDLIFNKHGEFDHKKLAQCIFKNPIKKQALEACIHPLVMKLIKQDMAQQKSLSAKMSFYEIPLLSSSFFHYFDKIILITCNLVLKKERLIKKGWTNKDINLRLSQQTQAKDIMHKAHFVLKNNYSKYNLYKQIDDILKSIILC